MADAWAQTALGAICRFQAGDAFGRDDQGRTVGDHPFIKVSDMNLVGNEIYISRANNWVSDEEAKQNYRLHPKDAVVFAKIGIALTYNRRRRLVRPTVIDNNMMSAVSEPNVDPVWFYYLLSTIDFNLISSGSALPYLTVKDLSKIQIDVPTLREQRAIASVLGALDDKIELNRRMNETLEAMARAIFKDWFFDFGPTRAKMEGRAPYLASDIWSLFPDRLDDEGKPEGWRYWPLQQIIDFKSGQNWLSQYRVDSSKIPAFGANGRIGFSSNYIDEGRVIFVGKIGSCGSINEYNGKFWATNNTYYVKQPSTKYIEHARFLLKSIDWMPFIGGSSNPYMPLKNFDHLQCLVAADAIHEAFETNVGALRSFIEHCEQENASLAATRDFLLPKLMSGEVRVKDAEKLVGEPT